MLPLGLQMKLSLSKNAELQRNCSGIAPLPPDQTYIL